MSKREARSDQQREKLLSISREMFAENGYEATTTRMINQAAGTSEGTLYYYFPQGKHEILDTIIYQGVINRVNQLQVSFEDCETVVDIEKRLLSVFEEIWQVFRNEENYQSFMITIHERMLLSDHQANWLLKVTEQLVNQIAEQLNHAKPLAAMTDKQRRAMARVIISIFQKIIYDELLIKNNRELPAETRNQIIPQLRVILDADYLEESQA